MTYRNDYRRSRYATEPAWRQQDGAVRRPRAPFRRPVRPRVSLVAALAVAAALAACAWYACASPGTLLGGASAPLSAGSGPASTPQAEWRAGEVPELYQRDTAWADARYAGTDFGESGCGPTCLAMAYIAATGNTDRTPSDLGALAERMGCASEDGTAWLFMTEGAAAIGLAAEELPADEMAVRRALNAGQPVICSMAPGDFTTTGHFIVLAGVDANGRLVIRDPNSPERTAAAWDFDRVLSQCRALWAYSVA